MIEKFWSWFIDDFLGIFKEMRWSYIPPLMVYFAAGISGFTGIIEGFFVKDELGLSAAFLAGLGFWAMLPWACKMPFGHLVDIFWKQKAYLVYFGATLMFSSLLIMVGLTGYTEWMASIMNVETWYIVSVLLSPLGFVLQDVVADGMTVEAVSEYDENGNKIPEKDLQRQHITMQTLGRIAIVGGVAIVAGLGGWLANVFEYVVMYKIALVIPVISVFGVFFGYWFQYQRRKQYTHEGFTKEKIEHMLNVHNESTSPNWKILGGSGMLAVFTVIIASIGLSMGKEIIFTVSIGIVIYLMRELLSGLKPEKRLEIIGIAIIIFVFRAMPGFGAASSWWQIDVLHFDEAFFGTLRQISSILAIIGMFALRGWMARRPIPYLVIFLVVYGTVMTSPYIGMYYGLHEWTNAQFGFGAHTIAIIDTMADSPLGQVAMIPMLAWIAKEAPKDKKATYFAIMAAFTNQALALSQLSTQYVNKIFIVPRGEYSELGMLMITVTSFGLIVSIITVLLFNPKHKLYFRFQNAVQDAFRKE